jgi:sarcosine dehydrogenase
MCLYFLIQAVSSNIGYRHWHSDLRSDDTPLEAGLGFTCKLGTDIDFLGRKALEEQVQSGTQKRLTCFTLEEKQLALWGLEGIWDDRFPEAPVGFLRRADYSFTLNKSIGYGYVNKMGPARPPGSQWTQGIERGKYSIEVMGERVPAQAHLRSLFDPQNLRLKGQFEANPGSRPIFPRDSIPGSELGIPGLRIPVLGKFPSKLLQI